MGFSITSIGEYTFSASLLVAIVSSVFAIALASNGVDPSVFHIRMFTGMGFFYDRVYELSRQLPNNPQPSDVFWQMITLTISGATLQFILSFFGAFLLFIWTLADVMPPQVAWLTSPLFFMAGFLQFTAWIYLVNLMVNRVSWLSLVKK